jgi:S-adenosylmethionine:tRNA ribosyltransferase-isomerase
MRVDLFDFELPEERIALRPARPRDAARLMVVKPGEGIADKIMRDLPGLLRAGDALVLNDTKVIPAELRGERVRGDDAARIAATLIKRIDPSRWRALTRPAKRLRAGDRVRFGATSDNACLAAGLDATVEEREEGEVLLRFDLAGPFLDEAIVGIGHVPLPPYIAAKRPEDDADKRDYQTIFARAEGAVAAPTAGLHFTNALFGHLHASEVTWHGVTLHVGPGTFLPVKADDTLEHRMHAEWGEVSERTATALNEARAAGGRIVAIGTTSLRLIESAAEEDGTIKPFAGETSIFITPGSRFRAVDLLLTNFHLPRSTLFMLVSAFSGRETMLAAYRHAIEAGYRFYSYGDACLLHPEARA